MALRHYATPIFLTFVVENTFDAIFRFLLFFPIYLLLALWYHYLILIPTVPIIQSYHVVIV